MLYPQVEIKPGEPIEEAQARVESAYEALGGVLLAFDHLNSYLPISSYCHFFQAHLEEREIVLVVTTREWDEKTLLTVLNILLEIRMDPDPPGQPPLFRFYSADPIPPVFLSLFGDTETSDFESRAALIARFGKDLLPSQSMQFAAAGAHLLRESLGIQTDLYDVDGEVRLGRAIVECLRQADLPEDAAPLNSLISIGFLYGEILRARFPHPSRWVRLRGISQWPLLVFGPAPVPRDNGAESLKTDGNEKGDLQVIFNPIEYVMALYKGRSASFLKESTDELAKELKAAFEGRRQPSE